MNTLAVGDTPSGPEETAFLVVAQATPGAQPARAWVDAAPGQVILRGAGRTDIAPMLSPMLLLAILFAAASAYTSQAAAGRTARSLDRAGAGPWSVTLMALTTSLLLVVSAFALLAVLDAAITLAAHAVGSSLGLSGITVDGVDPMLLVAAVAMTVLLTGLAVAGARAGERLAS